MLQIRIDYVFIYAVIETLEGGGGQLQLYHRLRIGSVQNVYDPSCGQFLPDIRGLY